LIFSSEQWVDYRDNGPLVTDLAAIKDAIVKKDTDNGDKDKKTKTDGGGKNPGGGGGKNPGGDTGGGSRKKTDLDKAYTYDDKTHWKWQHWSDNSKTKAEEGVHDWKNREPASSTTEACYCSVCGRYMGTLRNGEEAPKNQDTQDTNT